MPSVPLSRLLPGAARSSTAEFFRHLARLAELGPGREFVYVPCGRNGTAQLLAEASGATGAGVDPDPEVVAEAMDRARAAGLEERLHFAQAPAEDLPYKDGVFDVAVGGIELGAVEDPACAVRELARVTRPLGSVVLSAVTWVGHVEPERREEVVRRIGLRPLLLVEWKQMLRDAGVVDLRVENWPDPATVVDQTVALDGSSDPATLREAFVAFCRACRRWVQGDSVREELRSLFTRERVLGLSLIKGVKWQDWPSSRGP
jgi:SAM-dependent methyltransferase